jgi:hypothetical protein
MGFVFILSDFLVVDIKKTWLLVSIFGGHDINYIKQFM